ncbi:Mycothiol acetyltransferase [Periweissella ghanensis]|uniref:Mycothiol acetyltransferase n=2 Tax=Periweissella ghanensis TaxID=467997 RepID=A0ABM8ZBK1_9LACO|nr:Mycothiol acetyltransferase [Periweissella ghanensis]
MEFKTTNNLNVTEYQTVNALISKCQKVDQLFDMPYLANTFNFYPAMPAFILAYEATTLVGFVSIYAATDFDANLMVYVDPMYRRQGIATKLLQQAKQICQTYEYVEIVIQTEAQQLAKLPTLVTKFKVAHDPTLAEALMQWHAPMLVHPKEPAIKEVPLTVRLVTLADVKPLAKIHAQGFDDDVHEVTRDLTATFTNDNLQVYVFELNKQVVGSVTIEVATAATGYLFGYVIKKSQQGKGYGQQALAQVLALIAAQGVKTLSLAVDKNNLRAQYIYQKHGFVMQTTLEYLVGVL